MIFIFAVAAGYGASSDIVTMYHMTPTNHLENTAKAATAAPPLLNKLSANDVACVKLLAATVVSGGMWETSRCKATRPNLTSEGHQTASLTSSKRSNASWSLFSMSLMVESTMTSEVPLTGKGLREGANGAKLSRRKPDTNGCVNAWHLRAPLAYLECALVLKKCEYLNCENHALITLFS